MSCDDQTARAVQNGAIYLCGRSDGDPSRSFSGSVAHLSLFSTVLTASQIRDLYRTVLVDTLNAFRSQAASAGPPATAPLASGVFAAPGIQLAGSPQAGTGARSGRGSDQALDLGATPVSAMDLLIPTASHR